MDRLRELNSKKALTPEEAAEAYGLNRGSLANMRLRKEGPRFYRIGRKVIYKVEDLERWLYATPVHTVDSVKE